VATELRSHSYDDPVVLELVQEMADDLAHLYGPASYPPQDPKDWSSPLGCMAVVYSEGVAVGCGGFIRHDERSAELKRMFVRPAARRRGLARRLLRDLEGQARSLGYERVVLETGAPQVEARELYLSEGYRQVTCWPPHDVDPTSMCFAKSISRR
jgi:GNAT superfamily N-acetyltransferase